MVQRTNNEIFQSLTAAIGIFFVFLFLRFTYVIFLLLYIVGFFAIIKIFYSRIQQLNYEFNKAIEKSSGSYIEGLSNILTIKTLGAKKSFSSHIAQKEDIRKKFEYKIRSYDIGQWIAFQVFNGICIAAFLLLVGRDVFSGLVTLGAIVMFYGYLDKLTGSAGQFLSIYEEIVEAKTATARMMPIFWTKTTFREGQKPFPHSWDRIEIKNAGFDYNPEQKNKDSQIGVSNITLTIRVSQLGAEIVQRKFLGRKQWSPDGLEIIGRLDTLRWWIKAAQSLFSAYLSMALLLYAPKRVATFFVCLR